MSLLKYLQRELTSVDVPWLSTSAVSGPTARLINEIVLREETDELPDGRILSHFQLYREAMASIDASTSAIDGLLADIERGKSVEEAVRNPSIPRPAAAFVEQTFSLIGSGQLPAIAAAFAFGREEVIPEVLCNLGAQVSESAPEWTLFQILLERRIKLDGARQSYLAGQMVEEICGSDDDRWHEAILAAKRALEARLGLWDGILAQIDRRRPTISALAV